MKRYVLVTAAKSEPGKTDVHGAGIKKLKRGVSIQDFIHDYFSKLRVGDLRNDTILDSPDAHVLERNGMYTVVYHTGSMVLVWNFSEYAKSELLTAVKHLTREEFKRDVKELQ